jgi:hypothetical protein
MHIHDSTVSHTSTTPTRVLGPKVLTHSIPYLVNSVTPRHPSELLQHRTGTNPNTVGEHAAAGDHRPGANRHSVADHGVVDADVVLDHRAYTRA